MIKVIGKEWHQEFEEAVRAILPVLCFSPEQVDAFIQEYAPQSDGRTCVIVGADGAATFCRYSVDGAEVFLDYVLPSVWEDRYELIKGSILALRDQYLTPGSQCYLRMHVDERLPSYAAYFLGLLPELGFRLIPRVTMTAPAELIERLALPDLPEGVAAAAYRKTGMAAIIDVYARAYRGKRLSELAAAEWDRLRDDETPYLTAAFAERGAVETWTGLRYGDELIGCSFGEVAGDRMTIEEVVVVPEQQAKGLGRYLTISCMQKLHAQHGGPASYFFLGTDRRWTAALKLYHRIGFTLDRVESYAVLNA